MRKRVMLLLVLAVHQYAWGQAGVADYVQLGLERNLVLKERNVSLEKSVIALKDSRSLFLPSIDFIGNYTLAQGGRTFNFPAGDLLNPVYSTLNQLTSSQNFPSVNNAETQFFPNNFYDAHVRISYPVLNTAIYSAQAIKQEQYTMQQHEVDIYKNELIKEIKQAYYNYCTSVEGVAIYKNAFAVVSRNLKVNQSLFDNGQSLAANVLRAESEKQGVISSVIESENVQVNARNYFNFLLNRPLQDSIVVEKLELPDSLLNVLSESPNTTNRSELKKLITGLKIYDVQQRLNRNYIIPKINVYLDLGSQGFDFAVDSKTKYYFFGAQIDMPIFNGFRNRYKIHQTRLDISSLELQKSNAESQLQLAAITTQNSLRAAVSVYQSSQKELSSATAYFNLVEKGYTQGVNTLIEFIDARNKLTASQLQVNINRLKILSQLAEYERQTQSSQNN
jgi:outer membrane protein